MSAIYDASGRYLADAPVPLAVRPDGPWLANTIARAQRDADAPVVALVSRHPDRLAFIGGKLALVKA